VAIKTNLLFWRIAEVRFSERRIKGNDGATGRADRTA
jgi:hypothetical protein